MSAADRLTAVTSRMAEASVRAGRKSSQTTLIAVSKTHDAKDIRPLIAAGQRHFGENRVQEATAKWPDLRAETPGLTLHLIGQLQSNKAAEAVALFDVIQTVDRPSLVTALARAMDTQGKRPQTFIQINIGAEPQKGGCAITDLPDLLSQARTAGLDVGGLMAIPPVGRDPAPFFALLAKLADDHGLAERSMGMSSDFEVAIQLGSTMVRIGTALFGDRQPLAV